MNLRRFILAAAVATMATAALAPAAHAWTQFSFATQGGAVAQIEVAATASHTRLEVARGATVLAQSTGDSVSLAGLQAGDVSSVYNGTTLVASGTYDGCPRPPTSVSGTQRSPPPEGAAPRSSTRARTDPSPARSSGSTPPGPRTRTRSSRSNGRSPSATWSS